MNSYFSKNLIIIAFILFLILSVFDVGDAAFNEQINYQGNLTDDSNQAVSDGDHCMKFRLMDSASDGNELWAEALTAESGNCKKVTTSSGLFSVMLGKCVTFASQNVNFNSENLYLEVQYDLDCSGWDEVFEPRKKLGAIPAAFEAKQLAGFTWESPGTLGSTTRNTGAFTTLSAAVSDSSTALTVTQSSTGNIADFIGDSITSGVGLSISANGLVTGTALDISSTSTAGGESGSSKLLNFSRSGVNANPSHTAYGLYAAVTNTGTTSTNIAGYFSASEATNNYGLIVENGNVGIGDTSPDYPLEILSTTTPQLAISYNDASDYTTFEVAADGALTITTRDNIGVEGDIILMPDGNVGIRTANPGYKLSIGSTDGSDQIGIYHDNSHAYFKTTDGYFIFQTDEGTDMNTHVQIYSKDSGGTGFSIFSIYDQDHAEYLHQYIYNGEGVIGVGGTSPVALHLQQDANTSIFLFSGAEENETPELKIYGYATGDQKRSLEIGVGVDAADTASFDGVGNYYFDGNVGIGDDSPVSLLTVGSGDLFQVNSSGEVVAGTWKGTAIADAYIPNNITIDLATTATALAANGANCAAGNAPLGVDASGAVESCFDVWTEAENTAAGYISATLTEEEVEDYVGGMLGGTETHISVTYQDDTNDIDFVVSDDWWDALGDISLTSAQIIVGNVSNVAVAVAMTGDITITNTGVTSLANDTVAVAEFLGSQDWGDMSTAADGTVSLDADVVGTAEIAHVDFGDWTYATGLAVVENVQCSSCIDISAETNLAAGTGITLSDDTLSADLGTSIDISDETNLAVSGTLLNLSGDTLNVKEGTLTDGKGCKFTTASGLVCDQDYLTSAITSLGGLTGAAQTFVNDTNVTMTSAGTTHTLGWTGTLADGRIASASTWDAKENALTFSTGLTRTVNTITVNTSQNITTLSNLTSNGFVKTSGGTGTLSVDTNTYLTGNQSITLSGDVTGSGATAITTTIGANKILESMLKEVDGTPADEDILTYEITGDFQWHSSSELGIGTATSITDNLIVPDDFAHSQNYGDWSIDASGVAQIDSGVIGATEIADDSITNTEFTHSTDWGDIVTDTSGNVNIDSGVIVVGDLSSTDFGDWTCNGTSCSIDSQNSAFWIDKVSDETGTGAWVFATSPALATPSITTSLTVTDDDWIGLGASKGRIVFDDDTTDYVYFSDTNVGIGTTGPDTLLHLSPSSGVSELRIETADTNDPTLSFKTTNTTHGINMYLDEDKVTDELIIAGQTAGVHTSLQLFAKDGQSAAFYLTSGGSNYSYIVHASDDNLQFTNATQDKDIIFTVNKGGADTEIMRIDGSAGNVGIGDDSPVSLLTVGSGDLFQVNSSGEVVAGTWKGTAIADAYIPNNITIDLAASSTALAANGANCAAGNAPLGVDASGAVESCFDIWTEAENTAAGYFVKASDTLDDILAGTTNVHLTATLKTNYDAAYSHIHNLTTDIDHDQLTNFTVDEHFTQAAISITESQISDFGTYLENITGESIGDLSDIDTTGIADTKILKYNSTSGNWEIADDIDTTYASSDFDHNSLTNTHNLTTDIDHDALTNFASNEHFLQTAITNVSTALSTGLLKVTTGTGALSSITDNSTNWDSAYDWGDHSGQGYLTSVAYGDLTGSPSDVITAGSHISWTGTTLNVADDWYDTTTDFMGTQTDTYWCRWDNTNGEIDCDVAPYTDFGADIGPTELSNTDFGDFTCNGTSCALDNDVIAVAEFLASQDWGDMSTDASGNVYLDADVVGTAEIAHVDFGDWTYATGLAVVENVQCSSCIDISAETNLAAGTNITLSGDTLNVDDAFLINSGSDIAGAGSGFTWTFDASVGTDPVLTFGDGVINVSAGALQVGGSAVLTTVAYGDLTGNPSDVITAGTGLFWATDTLDWSSSGLTWAGNAIGDAYIPNDITIDLAASSTALAANGANCAAGNAPLGIDTSGAVESCFDVWTEAENTTAGYISATLSEEAVEDFAWSVLGGTQTLINVTYQDETNVVDFVINNDLSQYSNATSGFLTTVAYGDLTGNPSDVITAGTGLSWSTDTLDWSSSGLTWAGNAIGDDYIPNDITIDLATLATTLTITDNEDTNETNAVIFTSGGDLDGGNLGLESDGDFHYNPSTGMVSATGFTGAQLGVAIAPASNRLINLQMSSTDLMGLYVDGDTNPYTGLGYSHMLRGRRTWDWGTGDFAQDIAGNLFYVTHQSSDAKLTADKSIMVEDMKLTLDGQVTNNTASNNVLYAFGLNFMTDNNATYDTSSTGTIRLHNRNVYSVIDEDSTFPNTGGAGTNRINNEAFYALINSNLTVNSGNFILQNMGLHVAITASPTYYGGGWLASTNYGIYIETVTGAANANWGILDISGANWGLTSDNQKIIWGAEKDASIYWTTDGDDHLKLDPQELAAGHYLVLNVPKTTAGDPANPIEGLIYWNTEDNKIKMYAESGWRELATWTSDISEYAPTTEDVETGDLVVISKDKTNPIEDPEAPFLLEKSTESYQANLIGVIADIAGGATIGDKKAEHYKPLVLAGRVPVKVSTENGSIESGDYLTSSSAPGKAMKATQAGPVIGKALESFDGTEEQETIMVFINLGWYGGELTEDGSIDNEDNEEPEVTISGFFIQKVKQALASLGLFIENGIAYIEEITTKKITIDFAKIKKAEIDELQVNKIQMVDQKTGDIYCTWIEYGEMKRVRGECSTIEFSDSSGDNNQTGYGEDQTGYGDQALSTTKPEPET